MRAFFFSCVLALSSCARRAEVPIFLWHGCGEGSDDKYDVVPAEFEDQLKVLEEFHATTITLEQLTSGDSLPKRPVVLTFDDGRQCLFDHTLPLLQKHHMVGTAFIVTGWTKDDQRYRFTDDTGTHPALLWNEVKSMRDSGTFTIGSHSDTHPRFSELSDEQQRQELQTSRRVLQQHLPGSAEFFAWPYGALAWSSKSLAKDAGYRGAVTVDAHSGGPFALKRISIWQASTSVVRAALVSAYGEP